MRTSLIVAADEGELIGRDGGLPWHLPEDLRRFKALTSGHVVLLGRVTFDSIVRRLGRSLPGRFHVVVSRQRRDGCPRAVFEQSVESALGVACGIEEFAGRDEVFVLGGAQVYREVLASVDRVYLTRVFGRFPGDTRMPEGWLEGFDLADQGRSMSDGEVGYRFETYERRG